MKCYERKYSGIKDYILGTQCCVHDGCNVNICGANVVRNSQIKKQQLDQMAIIKLVKLEL